MELVAHKDAATFLAHARVYLEEEQGAANHHIVQIAEAASRGSQFFVPPYFFWVLSENDEITGVSAYANPDGLVLSAGISCSAASRLVESAYQAGCAVLRLVCDEEVVTSIRSKVDAMLGDELDINGGWIVAQTDLIQDYTREVGDTVRLCTSEDRQTVLSWAELYQKEEPAFIDIPRFIEAKLQSKELFLLENQEVLAMATISGRSKWGARISSVFTPQQHRQKGCAGYLVRMIANQMLEHGSRFVVLTYGRNSASGAIYESVGFQPVCYRECLVSSNAQKALEQNRVA